MHRNFKYGVLAIRKSAFLPELVRYYIIYQSKGYCKFSVSAFDKWCYKLLYSDVQCRQLFGFLGKFSGNQGFIGHAIGEFAGFIEDILLSLTPKHSI